MGVRASHAMPDLAHAQRVPRTRRRRRLRRLPSALVATRVSATKVWAALATVDGFDEGASVFSDNDRDRAYYVNGTQVAHTEADGTSAPRPRATPTHLALRLTRKLISADRDRLRANARVERRSKSSDWIMIDLVGATDEDLAEILYLAEQTASAHRASPGTPTKPPPDGADLARRRRFH
jgi:hypothetical protein